MSFINFLRRLLKKYFPYIYNNSSGLRNFIYKTFFTSKIKINILNTFEEFSPNVSGEKSLKVENTIYNIKNFSKSILRVQPIKFPVKNIFEEFENNKRILGNLFDSYGSDKKTHGYDLIYNFIIEELEEIDTLIEIGIGSNNEDVLSNMSRKGKPGSSLRSFRDYLPDSQIVGLEFDKNVLFEEERIKTFYFDQNHIDSLDTLPKKLLGNVDILIDDGLHSVVANINSLYFAEKLLKKGGFLIIEDISKLAEDLYQVMLFVVNDKFSINIYTNNSCLVAVLKKN